MKTLKSYVLGSWQEGKEGNLSFVPLVDPSTEEVIARASSEGIDFGAVLDYARQRGGPALRAMSFGQRAALLKEMSKVLRDNRDELLELSARNTGTTRGDGSFDIDGASGTLAYYASIGWRLGDRTFLSEGEGVQLAKTEGFYGGPSLVRGPGATALVTERCVELIVAAGFLPEGAFQLIVGSTGDLLNRLQPDDVLAFTGSADTALGLRSQRNILTANTRVNVEADSLNAAVLAPDVADGSATFGLFLKDVVREMTQKTGQKCTAVRRILVPADRMDAVQGALIAKLSEVVVGNPADPTVKMGPVATAQQLKDTLSGIGELARSARLVHGTGQRVNGTGAPAGKGYFVRPTLLRADDARAAGAVHSREVFAPVATLLPYDGTATDATAIVALGGGTLVTSAYTDDAAWAGDFVARGGGGTGRIYLGSEGSVAHAPGYGAALPQPLHGGPGRAGGGEELGGMVGVKLYLQRVAVQGTKALVDGL